MFHRAFIAALTLTLTTTFILVTTLTYSSTLTAASLVKRGMEGEQIKQKKHLDVFLSRTITNLESETKLPASFQILDYGFHRCTLEGVAWREDEKVFDAMMVETGFLVCKGKKYPAKFYSRVITDKDMDLSGNSVLGSHAKASIEIFLVRLK